MDCYVWFRDVVKVGGRRASSRKLSLSVMNTLCLLISKSSLIRFVREEIWSRNSRMWRSDRRHTFPYGTDLPSYVVSFKQASGPFSSTTVRKRRGTIFFPQPTISKRPLVHLLGWKHPTQRSTYPVGIEGERPLMLLYPGVDFGARFPVAYVGTLRAHRVIVSIFRVRGYCCAPCLCVTSKLTPRFF